jgi:hypothetical protein
VYEELFALKHYGSWSFIEAYNLPVQLRRWFVERLIKEHKRENEEMQNAMARK